MSDLIERQAAIDAVYKCADIFAGDMPVMVVKSDAYEALAQLPSAQPKKRTEKHTETHACDYINRKDAIDAHYEYCNKHPDAGFPVWSLKILEDLPSAQPDLSEYSDKLWKAAYERGKAEALDEIVRCKDCKHWKDSDGVYRRGIGAESKCPVNIRAVYEGNFYCADAERRTNEHDDIFE